MFKKRFVLEITGLVLLIVLTVTFTLIVFNKKVTNTNNFVQGKKQSKSIGGDSLKKKIELSEFFLQESESEINKYSHFFLRKRHKKWTEKEIDKYWKNPAKILGEILEKENENKIEALLKD